MADSSIVNPGSSSYNLPDPTTAPVGDVPQMPLERALPRQISTGDTRGVQSNTGENLVRDPVTSNTVINTSGITQNTVYSDPNTNTPQVVIGKLPDNKYGLKIAPPGLSVLTATNDQLIFNSEQNVFKIVQSGTIAFPSVNFGSAFVANSWYSTQGVVTKHNLGYAPAILAYLTDDAGGSYQQLPYVVNLPGGTGGGIYSVSISAQVDTEDVTMLLIGAAFSGAGGYNFTGSQIFSGGIIKYYLLQETAS